MKIKFIFFLISTVCCSIAYAQNVGTKWGNQSGKMPGLKVSDNGRYLVYEDGSPFFWLGDTAWELFHRLNREESDVYQSSHAAKGFDNGIFAELDRKLVPVKPTLDGEPRYENIMTGFYYRGNHPADRFTNYDARTEIEKFE